MKKYLAEGLLIIFSVLFALFINKLYEDYKTNQQKNVAITSIKKELSQNKAILENWMEKHQKVRERLVDLIEGRQDSLRQVLSQKEYLDFALILDNQSLVDAFLTHTAWETAKSTQIISEFDFETTQTLTRVYELQNIVLDKTLAKILDLYFDRESHRMEDLDAILVQYHLRFMELVGQEYLLEQLYEEALKELG